MVPIFDPIAQLFLAQMVQWLALAETVVGWVTPVVLLGLTILILWHGMNVMRGAGGSMHLVDVFMKSMRAFLVVSLALAGGAYSTNVIGFIVDLRTDLVNLFVAAPPGSSSYAALDQSVGKATKALNDMMPWVQANSDILPLNLRGLLGLAAMALMVGCVVIYCLVSAVNLLLIDVALTIIFAVGPLFVACFAFESTAKFFDAWLGGALKYVFTAVVVSAVLSIGNGVLATFATQLGKDPDTMDLMGGAFAALGATGMLIMIAFRVPEIAGNIVGGIGLSVFGPAAASAPLAAMGSGMKSGARAGANAASYGAGAAAGTGPGQAVTRTVSALANTSLGQRAVAAGESAARFGRATTNMRSGSVGAAYNAGSGAGTGVVTGARPLTPPTR